jgi:hypothetical protein
MAHDCERERKLFRSRALFLFYRKRSDSVKFYGSLMPLQQWEIGRKLVVDDATVGDEVHFTSLYHTTVTRVQIMEEDGNLVVEVPYFLLQKPGYVYAYRSYMMDGERLAGVEFKFPVKAVEKPADYPYEEVADNVGGGGNAVVGGGSALHVCIDDERSADGVRYATHTSAEIDAALEAGREVLFSYSSIGVLHNGGMEIAHLQYSTRDSVSFMALEYDKASITVTQYDIDKDGRITLDTWVNTEPIHLVAGVWDDGSITCSSMGDATMGETFGATGIATLGRGVLFTFYPNDDLNESEQTASYKADYSTYDTDKTSRFEFYLKDGTIIRCVSVESTAEDARFWETIDTWSIDTSHVGEGGGGKDGYTPQKGVDYWTAADKAEIIEELKTAVPAEIPAYTEADYGKMLTPTADGLVWTDPPEGGGGGTLSVPSAQGVVF